MALRAVRNARLSSFVHWIDEVGTATRVFRGEKHWAAVRSLSKSLGYLEELPVSLSGEPQ